MDWKISQKKKNNHEMYQVDFVYNYKYSITLFFVFLILLFY